MRLLRLSLISLLLMFLVGCSSSPRYSSGGTSAQKLSSGVDFDNQSEVRKRLIKQYKRWKGTPYRYGGTSLSGVDCSAYVQNTFRSKLGYKIPRTTRTQIKKGHSVKKSRLRIGDIVFFKTGRSSLHNGIYLGKSQFMHASSSKGVVISSLNNSYWQNTYLTSRRIR